MFRLPSKFWPASFKISRAISLSSSAGCRKSRIWVRADLAWEWRPELQLNRRKGFCCIAEDSRKRLQDSPLPSGIHQHPAQLARCMGTSCSMEWDRQLYVTFSPVTNAAKLIPKPGPWISRKPSSVEAGNTELACPTHLSPSADCFSVQLQHIKGAIPGQQLCLADPEFGKFLCVGHMGQDCQELF